ncbi:sensor histidine kinase response [Niveomyces insectorum RCEF 264]|uniref:histidine kinase n=1 Tax=Niveomyces insectorum RCEF 264 TaxID=1081102 RepID=A0A167ZA63_9HYPO|nr:sensor histidine kinase response [Niveomyces insectorum RCEF 264]
MASWLKGGRGAPSPLHSPSSSDDRDASLSDAKEGEQEEEEVEEEEGQRQQQQQRRRRQQPLEDENKSTRESGDRPPQNTRKRAANGEGQRRRAGSMSQNAERRANSRRSSHSGSSDASGQTSHAVARKGQLPKKTDARSCSSHHHQQQQPQQQHQRRRRDDTHAEPQERQPDVSSPQHQLSDYRQKLTREMSARVSQASPLGTPLTKRPSPIEEENASTSGSPSKAGTGISEPSVSTNSTDSARTVRAGETAKTASARTPSYPFPRMAAPNKATPLPSPGSRSTLAKSAHRAAADLATTSATSPLVPAATNGQTRPRSKSAAAKHDEAALNLRTDQPQSTPNTPASAMSFLPSSAHDDGKDGLGGGRQAGDAPSRRRRHNVNPSDLPSPNLYELVLALSSEPGLDAWWNTVVQLATQWYKAERVTLAIPADATDVENMPWGQKATFNAHEEDDELSLGYLNRGDGVGPNAANAPLGGNTPLRSSASAVLSPPSSLPLAAGSPQRPSLSSRYSYTAYEHQKQKSRNPFESGETDQHVLDTPPRPSLSRRQTSQSVAVQRSDIPKADPPSGMMSPRPYASLNQAALEEHDAREASHSMPVVDRILPPQREVRGRVLPVLQALDYEVEPLIDHNSVQRVLDRGRVVALTRSYPYFDIHKKKQQQQEQQQLEKENAAADAQASRATTGKDRPHSEASNKPPAFSDYSSLAPHRASSSTRPSASYMRRLTGTSIASKIEEAEAPRPDSPLYEECEQIPPSPWSQSPAPSPAVRHDPNENPFFSEAVVDEDSFNPALAPENYTETQPPEAIGVDNAWSVLHIPLYHPVLSKTGQTTLFKLDKSKMERKSSPKRKPEAKVAADPADPLPVQPKAMPIAILSILSPMIPYPSNLRHSLEHLAPHMATSFSLCLHYSNLEAEASHLNRRHHDLGGFGGVDTEGNPLPPPSTFANTPYLPSDDALVQRSIGGSMTSFSDYSAQTRSMAGSPGGTPGWDSTAMNMFLEKRALASSNLSPSVASLTGDGYFGMRSANTGHFGRPATTPGATSSIGGNGGNGGAPPGSSGGPKARKGSVTQSEKRLSALRPNEAIPNTQEEGVSSPNATSMPEQASTAAASSAPFPSSSGRVDAASVVAQAGGGSRLNTPSGESGMESSADNGSGTVSNQSGDSGRTGTENIPSVTSPGATGQKRKPAERDSLGAEEVDKASMLSPFVVTPGGRSGHPRQSYHPRSLHGHGHGHGHSRSHSQNQTHNQGHSQLHSYGADFSATFPSLPPSSTIAVKGAGAGIMPPTSAPSRAGSVASSGHVDMPPPSDRLKSLILDSLPAHVFVAMPHTGAIVWVNSRYLAYRGQTVENLAEDPWSNIHPDDRDDYLKAWSHSVRTGDQFSRTVRIRRFDGSYRWFQARAVASRDRRNSIVQFLGSYMDIHDQHIAELKAARQEEIEASEAKHRILANLIPQIIFTANEEEGITFANEQWLSYTGQSFQDLLGLGFMNSVHPDDLAKCSFFPVPAHLQERRRRLLQLVSSPMSTTSRSINEGSFRARGGGSGSGTGTGDESSELAELARRGIIMVTTDDNGRPSYTTEVRLRSKTGEYRWHLVRCVETGTMDFGKGYNSYFGSATDINDHKMLETKLKEAMDSKTRFLSNMSHEIRTPLIGISGMVSFLQDTTLDEEQRDYTNTIQTSANSLLMIINDILDLSKVDAGMMKLSYEWFHTRSLIEDVNELVSTMAIAKGLELNYVVDAEVPSWVKGDRVRIRQVLLNVIGNAIKFTAEGEVFSRCQVAEEQAGSTDEIVLKFSVTDTGRGFSKEEADLIFKPFSQIDGSSTRQHGGSGLGLVISRQLVELHGGKMNGSAAPGKGSTFTFTALFGLPTEFDHPDGLATPSPDANLRSSNVTLTAMGLSTPSFMDPAAVIAAAAASAAGVGTSGLARVVDVRHFGPVPGSVAASSGSSTDPSVALDSPDKPRNAPSRSSVSGSSPRSSAGFTAFGDAARASAYDFSQLKLKEPPSGGGEQSRSQPQPQPQSPSQSPSARPGLPSPNSSDTLTTATKATTPSPETENKPPAASNYSILIVCPQTHSREATTKHIETTLPKDKPHRITAVASAAEAHALLSGDSPEHFTHVVVNLPSPQEILELVDRLDRSTMLETANVLVLSDSVQRQAVNRLAAGTRYEQLLSEARVMYVYKPVKPSRFAVIFDPAKERDISIDRNRSSAQQLVETQKQSYLDLEQRMGNKGYKVLLVEDNMVNQKVLKKYLHKVGVEVDVATDGVECLDIVFSRPHDYYSLILCDLHMPRKDGYQACREIREWEGKNSFTKALPIIALSANVMSDVHDKCVEAGFNKYITKPVDFIVLSRALAEYF